MTLLWWRQLRTQDATAVDAAWSAAIGVAGIALAVAGAGSLLPRALAAGIAAAWSLRLTTHLLADRVFAGHGEDARYRHLREHLGARAAIGFFWLYQAQALTVGVFALPFLLLAQQSTAALLPVQWAGLALAATGATIAALADRQLREHRADPTRRGRTCRDGLWAWSRHPNYLGEWLTWCGIAAVASPAPGGALAFVTPLVLYLLITRVSGIPFAERQALRSRGDDYRAYQATVPAFLPWPRPRRPRP